MQFARFLPYEGTKGHSSSAVTQRLARNIGHGDSKNAEDSKK